MAKRGSYNPGPVTNQGKDTSSKNAIVHGGRSERHTILPDERAEEFTFLVRKWTAEFQPEGDAEIGCCQTIAEREWLLLRCQRNVDRVMFELMSNKPNPLEWTKDEHHALSLMQRYFVAAERHLNITIKQLQELRKQRISLKRLQALQQLKCAEVINGLKLADSILESNLQKVEADRINQIKKLGIEEWEIAVYRYEQKRRADLESNPSPDAEPEA